MNTRSSAFLSILTVFSVLLSPGLSFAETARAVLKDTGVSAGASGDVRLADTPEGLSIKVEAKGLVPGKHAIHIHEFGDCGDSGKAAGSHYNPSNAPHGFLPKDGASHAHPGDMGNIEAGPDGSASLHVTLPGVQLSGGPLSVAGRTVIVHAKEDDFGQPTGNAGDRVACGEILITKSEA